MAGGLAQYRSLKVRKTAAKGSRCASDSSLHSGFTLMEMLLVLAVLLLLSAVAWPVLEHVLADYQLKRSAETVGTAIAGARLRAIDAGAAYQFRYEPGGRNWFVVPFDRDDLSGGAESTAGTTAATARTLMGELPESLSFRAADGSNAGERLQSEALQLLPNAVQLVNKTWSPAILFYSDGSAAEAAFEVLDKEGDAFRISVRDLTGTVSIDRVLVQSLLNPVAEKK
ncbi:MAG: prepilin-type N-terminal cleavage/methylation domain-containing protein [Planctomycetaceae bacterium]